MKKYIGVKEILAKPMNRLEYNQHRGWEMPADENPGDEGYLVEYLDGGQSNHKDHEGYISWSPKDVFGRAYRPTDGMTFGLALEALKKGYKVAREGWNGKGMWLILVTASNQIPLTPDTPYFDALDPITKGWPQVDINPHIDIYTAQGKMQPGWLASQTDMLADDWLIVD